MTAFLVWLEDTPVSVLIRETPSVWGFPFILFLHTLGLAMLAGISAGISLWLLREPAFDRTVRMSGLYRVIWLGFGINAASGVALLLAYPAKALTDPVFYVKLALVAAGVFAVARIARSAFPGGYATAGALIDAATKRWAALALAIWAATVLAGRLLAYTARMLLTTDGF